MFKNLIRLCTLEQYRSDEALLDLKTPILPLNELHSQALLYLIELWKLRYSELTTKHHTDGQQAGLNIVELSQMSEQVVLGSTVYLSKVMKIRSDSTAELRENCESVRHEMLEKHRSK